MCWRTYTSMSTRQTNTHFADEERRTNTVDAQKALKIDVNMTNEHTLCRRGTKNQHSGRAEDRCQHDKRTHTLQMRNEEPASSMVRRKRWRLVGVDTTPNIAHYAQGTNNKHGGQCADNENMNMCQNELADREKNFWSTTMNDTKELKFPSTKRGMRTKKKKWTIMNTYWSFEYNNEWYRKTEVSMKTYWSFEDD